MKKNYSLLLIVILGLLFSAGGVKGVLAQTYTYNPSLQTYTSCGSGTCSLEGLSYSGCYVSGYDTYQKGQVHAALWSRNSSSGTLNFRVEKCSGYFVSGNSGKVLIEDTYYGDVYCTPFTIYDSYTSYVSASISNYGDFSGSRTFRVFLITSDLTYKFYAGDITIQAGYAPSSTCYTPIYVTETSATLRGCVNPNGEETTYRFRYGPTTSYGYTTPYQTLSAGNSCVSVSADISGLNPGTTYYFCIVAGNNSGSSNSNNVISFTTETPNQPPTEPSNPSPYNGATGVSTSPTLSWSSYDPEGGSVEYDLSYGTSSSNLSNHKSGQGTSTSLSGLNAGQTYYWRVVSYDNQNSSTQGPIWQFTTQAANQPPTTPSNPSPSNGATGVPTTLTLSWSSSDPEGGSIGYDLYYGTTTSNMTNHVHGQGTTANLSGLSYGQTYYWKVVSYDNQNSSSTGDIWHFTTESSGCFTDCTSNNCGDYGNTMYTAAQYLCNLGIVEGINGTLQPDVNITRAQLAKVALLGLYNGPNNVPNQLMTDYFPSVYPDLQVDTAYYYRPAKALLYLEYGDGVSPFDRDRGCFYPTEPIQRCFVLKVLMETFNIAPLSSGTNVFDDFGPSGYANSGFWGYAQKAYNLGIVQTTHFRPDDYCTRGEAFLYLYRILTSSNITKPIPDNDDLNPATSDFFIPANLSPKAVNGTRGVEYGNFNYYEKDFFNIPGYMNLDFGVAYNSYLTEMPDELYPVKPLGKAWTHTYDMYMNIVMDTYHNSPIYVFHMQDGSLLLYDQDLASMTDGNYYELATTTNQYILTSRNYISYTFERQSTSDGIYYLTKITDRNNNTINIAYSAGYSHYRISSVSTLGRTLNFYYTSGTDLLSYVKDPINRKVYFYFTDNQLSSLKDAKNQTTYFTYGTSNAEKGLLKEITLPKGNHVYNNYQQRKLVSMRRVNNSNDYTHTAVSVSPNYQNGTTTSTVTTTLNGNQSVTTNYTMNNNNRITNVNDNLHTNVSYEYNISNRPDLISKMTDNKSNMQSSYSYNSKGLLTSVTISAGGETHTMSTTYNGMNDIKKYTDANGNETNYDYNSNGNLTRVTDALGNQTNIVYNSNGAPTRVTNSMGLYVDYSYNNYGNVQTVSIPALNKTASMSYDNVSRMTSQTDFANHTTSYTYDNNDNVTTVTDAAGNTTTWDFDANDNVNWIQNPLGKKTYMTYDNNDFLTGMTFEGFSRSYTYNRDGSMSTYTDPNGHTFNYTYNISGELLGDGITTFGYNNIGRLESVTKDSKAINYTYDAFGRTTAVAYDGKTVSYTYDNNGNVLTMTYPGNKTVTYTYDALNRMTSVKDWNNATTNYQYRNDGQLDYYQYPNGVRTTYSYDNAGRCTGFSTKRNSGSGSVIAEYNFAFDDAGNHTSETFTAPYPAYPSIPTSTTNYSYNSANRITAAGNLSFSYDNNGNTTSRTGRTYGYDALNNLTSVSGDLSASYTYDGLGNRRTATRNGVTTKYVLNLLASSATVLMETNANGAAQNYYIYGASGLVSRIDASNNTRYYVYDYRGSTVAMTDATTSANVTHKYQYDDFGNVMQSEEADVNLFRYVGKFGVMFEDEALTFMRARYYDPEIGRFLSEDPIWSNNLYPYADNNPIMRVDPNGESWFDLVGYAGILLTSGEFALYDDANWKDIAITVGLGVVGAVVSVPAAAVIAVVGTVYSVASFGITAYENHLDKVDQRNEMEFQKKMAELNAQKAAQDAAQAAAQAAVQKPWEYDREAYVWMRASASTDSYAESLWTRWQIVYRHPDLSESKKQEAYKSLLKGARTHMNGSR